MFGSEQDWPRHIGNKKPMETGTVAINILATSWIILRNDSVKAL